MAGVVAPPAYWEARIAHEEAQTKLVDVERRAAELELKKSRRSDRNYEAEADWHRIYTFYDAVNAASVENCLRDLSDWSRRDPGKPITVVFNSPGGSVLDGLALYDYLRELSNAGHEITTVALGMAASMGGILLQAGDHRVIGRNAWLLIHEVSSIGRGKISEMEDEVKFTRRLADQCLGILAERSTLDVKQIARRWKRKDWWLNADESFELGFADEIR